METPLNNIFNFSYIVQRLRELRGKVYSTFLSVKRNILGTTVDEKYWSKRKISDTGDWNDKEQTDWIKGYWNSQTHPHRAILLDTIEKYHPDSILEVGCNCGPNLCLLAKKYPYARIVGIDINRDAVERGREFFSTQGITNVQLFVNKADCLEMFDDGEFDVVFTDAVLIYIGSDKILNVLKELLRITKKTTISLEWHSSEYSDKGIFCGHWVHNFSKLVEKIDPERRFKTRKITEAEWPDPKWIQYGYIIEICR
jgi:ubiquinone/menaquinone biosynthesis C-methylase UbiE